MQLAEPVWWVAIRSIVVRWIDWRHLDWRAVKGDCEAPPSETNCRCGPTLRVPASGRRSGPAGPLWQTCPSIERRRLIVNTYLRQDTSAAQHDASTHRNRLSRFGAPRQHFQFLSLFGGNL